MGYDIRCLLLELNWLKALTDNWSYRIKHSNQTPTQTDFFCYFKFGTHKKKNTIYKILYIHLSTTRLILKKSYIYANRILIPNNNSLKPLNCPTLITINPPGESHLETTTQTTKTQLHQRGITDTSSQQLYLNAITDITSRHKNNANARNVIRTHKLAVAICSRN